jgi:hypothetical protein
MDGSTCVHELAPAPPLLLSPLAAAKRRLALAKLLHGRLAGGTSASASAGAGASAGGGSFLAIATAAAADYDVLSRGVAEQPALAGWRTLAFTDTHASLTLSRAGTCVSSGSSSNSSAAPAVACRTAVCGGDEHVMATRQPKWRRHYCAELEVVSGVAFPCSSSGKVTGSAVQTSVHTAAQTAAGYSCGHGRSLAVTGGHWPAVWAAPQIKVGVVRADVFDPAQHTCSAACPATSWRYHGWSVEGAGEGDAWRCAQRPRDTRRGRPVSKWMGPVPAGLLHVGDRLGIELLLQEEPAGAEGGAALLLRVHHNGTQLAEVRDDGALRGAALCWAVELGGTQPCCLRVRELAPPPPPPPPPPCRGLSSWRRWRQRHHRDYHAQLREWSALRRRQLHEHAGEQRRLREVEVAGRAAAAELLRTCVAQRNLGEAGGAMAAGTRLCVVGRGEGTYVGRCDDDEGAVVEGKSSRRSRRRRPRPARQRGRDSQSERGDSQFQRGRDPPPYHRICFDSTGREERVQLATATGRRGSATMDWVVVSGPPPPPPWPLVLLPAPCAAPTAAAVRWLGRLRHTSLGWLRWLGIWLDRLRHTSLGWLASWAMMWVMLVLLLWYESRHWPAKKKT